MSWHYEWCIENFEAIKHLAVHSDITKKNYETILKMLNALFRITFQHFVRLPISFYNRIMKYIFLVFNVVVFIDFCGNSFCLQFHISFVDSTVFFKYTIVYCRIMYVHDVIKCVFLFSLSKFPDIYWIYGW